jgi:hypothetical protein
MSEKPPVYIKNGFLYTCDGVKLCRVLKMPGDCQLVFFDRNRQRAAVRGSESVVITLLDIARAVKDNETKGEIKE